MKVKKIRTADDAAVTLHMLMKANNPADAPRIAKLQAWINKQKNVQP